MQSRGRFRVRCSDLAGPFLGGRDDVEPLRRRAAPISARKPRGLRSLTRDERMRADGARGWLNRGRPKRVLLAWEYGAGRTHYSNLLAVASHLRASGVECLAALYDNSAADREFAAIGVRTIQNFVWPSQRNGQAGGTARGSTVSPISLPTLVSTPASPSPQPWRTTMPSSRCSSRILSFAIRPMVRCWWRVSTCRLSRWGSVCACRQSSMGASRSFRVAGHSRAHCA